MLLQNSLVYKKSQFVYDRTQQMWMRNLALFFILLLKHLDKNPVPFNPQ